MAELRGDRAACGVRMPGGPRHLPADGYPPFARGAGGTHDAAGASRAGTRGAGGDSRTARRAERSPGAGRRGERDPGASLGLALSLVVFSALYLSLRRDSVASGDSPAIIETLRVPG